MILVYWVLSRTCSCQSQDLYMEGRSGWRPPPRPEALEEDGRWWQRLPVKTELHSSIVAMFKLFFLYSKQKNCKTLGCSGFK